MTLFDHRILRTALAVGLCSLAGYAAAQCTLTTQVVAYANCTNVTITTVWDWATATAPIDVEITVDGVLVHSGTSMDPSNYSYEHPWGSATTIGSISVSSLDAAGCTGNATFTTPLEKMITPVAYSLELDCTTGMRTLRWTNADQACGFAGDHLAYVTPYNGPIQSAFFTQESSAVWRLNYPLAAGGHPFAIDYVQGSPMTHGFQCGGGITQCWTPMLQYLNLLYVEPGDCGVNFRLDAGLSGPMEASGLMNENLRTSGLLPLSEPYGALGYTYVGSPSLAPVPAYYMTTTAWAIVDWVVVELRSAADPAQVVYSKPAFINKYGRVRDPDFYDFGTGTLDENLNFPVPAGNYYVAIRHRNHLGVMTATAIALDEEPELLDLRSASVPTYGTDARKLVGAVWCLWSGDANNNRTLKYAGSANDRDIILSAIGGTDPTNALPNVYRTEDVNMDGVVKYAGSNNDRDPILLNIGGVPSNTRLAQIP